MNQPSKRYKQSSVSAFFQPTQTGKTSNVEHEKSNRVEKQNLSTEQEFPTTSISSTVSPLDESTTVGSSSSQVGQLLKQKTNLRQLPNDEKLRLLKSGYKPQVGFSFPKREQYGKNRSFQAKWLQDFPWLTYSEEEDGGLCRFCCLFAKSSISARLVTETWSMFHKGSKDLKDHECSQYHKDSQQKAMDFMNVMENKQLSVDQLNDLGLSERIKQNRAKLTSIVETVLFCGRQNIALRGRRDDAKDIESDPEANHGNFLALLNFRVNSGDVMLKQHLEEHAKNTSYTSKTVQNELITIIGDYIRNDIVDEVRNAKFFAVCADEVCDISNREQLSIVLRFVDVNNKIREEFLQFAELREGLSGSSVANQIMKTLQDNGLDLKNLRGQSYDGASNMSGHINGAAALIKQHADKAIYVHCNAHQLNLCIVKACKILPVSNMMSVVSEVSKFFNYSPKRQSFLEHVLETCDDISGRTKLIDLCKTRWVERYNALELFLDLFVPIVRTLEDMTPSSSWKFNSETTSTAKSLLLAITQFEFIISIIVSSKLLGFTKCLCKKLQGKALDICQAYQEISSVKTVLKEIREDIDDFHGDCYEEAVAMASHVGTEPSKPRRCGRQTLRNNAPADTPKQHFKINITIPFLDHLIQEMESRFSVSQQTSALGLSFVPEVMLRDAEWKSKILELADQYQDDIPQRRSLESELRSWNSKWKNCDASVGPKSLGDCLPHLTSGFYPNLLTLAKILCTLPITSCENERSFSALRRLKTWLRNSMAEDRMNGLAMMTIHYKREVDVPAIINIFARKNPRRMKFIDILKELLLMFYSR